MQLTRFFSFLTFIDASSTKVGNNKASSKYYRMALKLAAALLFLKLLYLFVTHTPYFMVIR